MFQPLFQPHWFDTLNKLLSFLLTEPSSRNSCVLSPIEIKLANELQITLKCRLTTSGSPYEVNYCKCEYPDAQADAGNHERIVRFVWHFVRGSSGAPQRSSIHAGTLGDGNSLVTVWHNFHTAIIHQSTRNIVNYRS